MRNQLAATFILLGTALAPCALLHAGDEVPRLASIPGQTQRNIVFILADDHRYDALGFLGHPFLKTPHLDRMATRGAYVKHAMVTTSLCSPSRASILTGLYAHNHGVVDNNFAMPEQLVFFPQYLQQAGYKTAFIGKWHMGGESDEPRKGFDRWVSFRGQGTYAPDRQTLNVDGARVDRKGYITDELTDYALEWLDQQPRERPFFLYLSHKAVHAEFLPAERHRGLYKDATVPLPPNAALTPESRRGMPLWVQNQRNSYHGVEFPYHGTLDVAAYYRRYCETLLAIDDSVGRVLDWLASKRLLDSTLILYTSDNGFMFGEHGLIDKRAAYEESIRVPMLAHCPELIPAGSVVESVVANIDIAPTLLEAAALVAPGDLDGRSFLPALAGAHQPRAEPLLYEYFWERNFPHTPTMHAIRTDRHKFIRYYGLWDVDELYDLQTDPFETNNLFLDPDHKPLADQLRGELFELLKTHGGLQLPMRPDRGGSMNLRNAEGSRAAEFPESFYKAIAPPSSDPKAPKIP